MTTYSFLSVHCSIVGPGGSVNLGQGAGASDEGISIEPAGDIDSMVIGADGTPMHSLHADKSGSGTVRLLKTSATNQQLMLMYVFQTSSPANHGQNTITLGDTNLGDLITCRNVAFKRAPNLIYGKEAGMNEWTFSIGQIDRALGGNA